MIKNIFFTSFLVRLIQEKDGIYDIIEMTYIIKAQANSVNVYIYIVKRYIKDKLLY